LFCWAEHSHALAALRQINNNPNPEHVARLWLLLCLVVVAFPPGKSFFKVRNDY